MEETQGNTVQETATEQTAETQVETAPQTAETTTNEQPLTADEPRSFTQDELNAIVKERLDRQTAKFLERLHLESMDGIDELLEHANGYSQAQELATNYQLENDELRQQIAFRDNDVNKAKIDDIRAYFKGKGLELNDDNLREQLATHPEWVNAKPRTTTVRTLSPEKNAPKSVDGWEQARKYFGL